MSRSFALPRLVRPRLSVCPGPGGLCPAGGTFKRRSSVSLCKTFNELPANRAVLFNHSFKFQYEGLENKHNFVRDVVSETNACDV